MGGSGTPSGTGTLQLKLSSGSAVADLAGNALAGTIPFNGQTYTMAAETKADAAAVEVLGVDPQGSVAPPAVGLAAPAPDDVELDVTAQVQLDAVDLRVPMLGE